MLPHLIELTNLPPAKKQRTIQHQEYSLTIENDFNVTLKAGDKIAADTWALINYFIPENMNEYITYLCMNFDPIATMLALGNKSNITFIIYDLNTELVYHNIKTNTKIKMYEPIKTANYLIYSDGNWYPGILKSISPSNDMMGYIYQFFFRGKKPDEHESEVRFKIARLSIEMLAKFPQNKKKPFEPNSYYTNDTPETVELVKKILRENNYPDITQYLFDTLSTNLSALIKQVNKSTQKINETNITTNIKFFTRIKDFSQLNQNIINLLKIFYLKRIENILNQINVFPNKQQTLKEITEFIVLIGEKLPNFTEEIIRFIAQVMKNLYLRNMISRSDIILFMNSLKEAIDLDIYENTDNLTTLIEELFYNDLLSLKMICLKHVSFWSDEQKENLTLPIELQEQLNDKLQYPGIISQ